MSIPPPPGAGEFFGAPSSPPPAEQYGYAVSAPATPSPTMSYQGYGAPAAGFGAPPPSTPYRPASVGGRTPELVVVACTLLVVFAAVGLYVAAAISSLSSLVGGVSNGAGDGSSSPHLGSYALIWGFCGVVDLGLAYFLRQGNPVARIATSLVCAGWTLYWLHGLVSIATKSTFAAGVGLGPIVGVAELLLFGLAVASALPAAVLWLPSTKDHFV